MVVDITDILFVNKQVLYAIIPVIVIGIYCLMKSQKKLLVLSRIIVAALIIIALASPYTITTHTISDPNPSITVINDQSSSMDIFDRSTADAVCDSIHERNPASQIRSFSGDQSPIGDKILQYARGNDYLVLVSDINSNYGRELADAISVASRSNTTAYVVAQTPTRNDASVEIVGSKTIILGNKNVFRIVVRQAETHLLYELVVKADDDVIYQSEIEQNGRIKVRKIPYTFDTLGSHVVSAEIATKGGGGDYRSTNNVFKKAVYVVPKPEVLLITDEESNLRDIVCDQYDARISMQISELKDAKAVILDNRYLDSLPAGEITMLRDFVGDGRGLVMVGGSQSYDRGGYLDSEFEKILPVKSYPSEYYGRNDVVIVMDVSDSTLSDIIVDSGVTFLDYEKALAIYMIDDKEFRDDHVGVVAFGGDAYIISGLVCLENEQTREVLKDTIRLKTPQGQSTTLDQGLSLAGEMLANSAGAKDVILISDGRIDEDIYENSLAVVTRMKSKNIKMHFIQVISSPTGVIGAYGKLAHEVDASYEQTTYPKSININTDQPDTEPTPTPPQEDAGTYAISVFDTNHFITRDLELSGTITGYNDVTPKLGAKKLVATDDGKPVVCAWRYGLGRVVSWSTDNGNEWSSALYSENNSQLISSTINWAIGDPRPEVGVVIEADDIFFGESSHITITSDTIPSLNFGGSPLDMARIAENTYTTEIDLGEQGVYYLSDYGIAVNYPLEYRDVGINPDAEKIIQSYGGRVYNESEVGMLCSDVRRKSVRTMCERLDQKIPFILAALTLFLLEVIGRRVREIMRKRDE
ncbi:MAG: VWA domain-containing protein [Euryarchaeota archaeon]|nr:VWA domain-containing protein [Euryarchaeota archaeon]